MDRCLKTVLLHVNIYYVHDFFKIYYICTSVFLDIFQVKHVFNVLCIHIFFFIFDLKFIVQLVQLILTRDISYMFYISELYMMPARYTVATGGSRVVKATVKQIVSSGSICHGAESEGLQHHLPEACKFLI